MQPGSQSRSTPRQEALALFADAERKTLDALWARWENKPEVHVVRAPETGLVMVRGRTGGGGAPFNLGEATVSRASVRIETGETGHGYCLGRDVDKARLIAVLDALFQREPHNVELAIVDPLRAARRAADGKRDAQTAATKVDFFTMVRGDD
ncbi:MAG TPA: phosphonate C-P lyase system protein PhnG [Devosia sp.]|nr:phosphonate C-P lyase system protein PhnG [Devosia sp.]